MMLAGVLAGCGSSQNTGSGDSQATKGDGSTLVVYYSATGSTKAVTDSEIADWVSSLGLGK